MKLGLQATTDYFKSKGDAIITKHYLYQGARDGSLPCGRAGNRIIFDTDMLEEFFRKEALKNIKPTNNSDSKYGKLRKVEL